MTRKQRLLAEQNAFDAYDLGDISYLELVMRLKNLNYDHYDAIAIANEIDLNRNSHKET